MGFLFQRSQHLLSVFLRLDTAKGLYDDPAFIDQIGYYDPKTKDTKIDAEKAQEWIKNGAQPTDTVRALFKKNEIIK